MRIRKFDINFEGTAQRIDMRSRGGFALQTVLLEGANGVGKTLSMQMALRLFQATAQPDSKTSTSQRYFSATAHGTFEFEYSNAIHVGAIKDGYVHQKPSVTSMIYANNRLVDGCLFYSLPMRLDMMTKQSCSISESTINMLVHDVIQGDIRNCVVWVDDFDVGMSKSNSRELLRSLMRAASSKDLQIILSCVDASLYDSVGEQSIKRLSGDVDYMQKAMKQVASVAGKRV
jgi:hypothetical protein